MLEKHNNDSAKQILVKKTSNLSMFTLVALMLCIFINENFSLKVGQYKGVNERNTNVNVNSISRKSNDHEILRSRAPTQLQATASPTQPGGILNDTPKNLKKAPGQIIETDKLGIISSWNELKGMSEKDLLLTSSFTKKDAVIREKEALSLAYRRCEYVTQLFSKTFYTGTTLMEPDARKHVWAVYAWCRRTDDIVDSPRALLNRETLQGDLREWDNRLERIWNDEPLDLFDMAMSDTVKAYPTLSIEPFKDMVKGMVMDVPGLGQERYETFDDLYTYCYRVAGTVGLMTLPILGTAEGVTEEQATEPAIALGIGLQLTNILRDVGEDLERGRIYLPQDEIKAFGLTEEDLFQCKVSDKYKDFIKFQIQRARDCYKIAAEGVPMLAPTARLAVQASLDLYSRILNVIERNHYDNFRKRAFTTKLEKASILPGSFIRAKAWKKT